MSPDTSLLAEGTPEDWECFFLLMCFPKYKGAPGRLGAVLYATEKFQELFGCFSSSPGYLQAKADIELQLRAADFRSPSILMYPSFDSLARIDPGLDPRLLGAWYEKVIEPYLSQIEAIGEPQREEHAAWEKEMKAKIEKARQLQAMDMDEITWVKRVEYSTSRDKGTSYE